MSDKTFTEILFNPLTKRWVAGAIIDVAVKEKNLVLLKMLLELYCGTEKECATIEDDTDGTEEYQKAIQELIKNCSQ